MLKKKQPSPSVVCLIIALQEKCLGIPLSYLFLLTDSLDLNAEEKAALIASTKSPISFLSKLGQSISRKRTPKVSRTTVLVTLLSVRLLCK